MKRDRRRRPGLVLRTLTALLVAAAVAAVAVSRGSGGPGSSPTESTGAGQSRLVSGARNPGSPAADASPTAQGSERTSVVALERAAGLDPRKLKKVPWIPNEVRVKRGEALPCTGIEDPINFEIFSAGPAVAGLPLQEVTRRCQRAVPAYEQPANFTNYLYGECEIEAGATGCQPPLQVQSFPACQRSLASYSLEGEPLPYKELPPLGGAVVVEIDLMGEARIEVYTGSTTIAIFATEANLARKALSQLRAQQSGSPPATRAGDLNANPEPSLPAPSEGAIEGELRCQA